MPENASTFLKTLLWIAVWVGCLQVPQGRAVAGPWGAQARGLSFSYMSSGLLRSAFAPAGNRRAASQRGSELVWRITADSVRRPSCARLLARMREDARPPVAVEYLLQAVERHCAGVQGRLWRLFRGKDLVLRDRAAELLPLVLGDRALPVLAELLRSPRPESRRAAVRGMVRLGRAALPELERALPVTVEAAEGLVEIGSREALALLARSWKWIVNPLVAVFLPERLRRSWYLLRLHAAAAARPLLPVEMSVPVLVPMLRWTSDPAAADFCMTALARGKGIPANMLDILAGMKNPGAATVFTTFLRAPKKGQRHLAALGLGRIGGPQVVAVLAEGLRPKVPAAFLRAAEALALTGRSEALGALLPHIKWTGALGKAAVSALGVLLREKGRFLRGPGAGALREKTLRLLRGMARSKGDPRRWWALAALGLARDREALDRGLALLGSGNRTEALAGCLALDGQGGKPGPAAALADLLEDPDERLAACAAWVLRDSRRERALLRALRDPRPMVSRNAAAALALGKFRIAALREAARSLDRFVRTAGLVGLARHEAIPFDRLALALARADEANRPAILAALVGLDRIRARRFLRDLSWRFQRLGMLEPGWLVRGRLEAWGRIFHRPEENFVVMALEGLGVAGRPLLMRPSSGLAVWWFAGPSGLVLRTGLAEGFLEVKVGPGREPRSRARRKPASARPGSRGGGKFRGH